MVICNPGIAPKNKHLQSFLASSKIRLLKLRRSNPLVQAAQEVLLETSEATLQGFYSHQKSAKKLYILLHGWEGSANSTYVQLLGNRLFVDKQASIFRLNFRDHGDTHHMNQHLFHSCRLNEVAESIAQVTQKFPHDEVYLCGFSLGANFSLRVASVANECNINLTKVFAISPPLVPKNSMLAIEKSAIYSRYFLRKWKKSLHKKQQLFPNDLSEQDFTDIHCLETLTRNLIISHSDFATTDAYFDGYAINPEVLSNISVPCEVLTAWDDPVIPFEDFVMLEKKRHIHLVTSKHGGHCGFIRGWRMNSWVEDYIITHS